MNEVDLLRKLAAINALIHGATTDGEYAAATSARERLEARLGALPQPPVNHQFTIPDSWSRQLFMALAKKMGLKVFRFRGQRRTTLMVNATEREKDDLWARFLDADDALRSHLSEVTERIILQALGETANDVVDERPQQENLSLGSG